MADRHREARQAVWRKLKNCRGNQAQALMKSVVTSAMYLHDVEIVEKMHHWEMTLLGKGASCTSSAEGVIFNWAEARLKEFGQ